MMKGPSLTILQEAGSASQMLREQAKHTVLKKTIERTQTIAQVIYHPLCVLPSNIQDKAIDD
jgi:hypothetical protein